MGSKTLQGVNHGVENLAGGEPWGRKPCRLKGLCCFRSLTPKNTDRQSRSEKTIQHNNFTHQRNTYAALRKKHGTTAFQPFLVLNKAANRQEGEIHT